MDFLQRVVTNHLKICVESEKAPNSQGNIEKENQSWGASQCQISGCPTKLWSSRQCGMAQKQTHRSMEQNREPRSGP